MQPFNERNYGQRLVRAGLRKPAHAIRFRRINSHPARF